MCKPLSKVGVLGVLVAAGMSVAESQASQSCGAVQNYTAGFDEDCRLFIELAMTPYNNCGAPLPNRPEVQVSRGAPYSQGGAQIQGLVPTACEWREAWGIAWHGTVVLPSMPDGTPVFVEVYWKSGSNVPALCGPAIALTYQAGNGDDDGDGIRNCIDNCAGRYNPNQVDRDGDGSGDVCDNCPDTANQGQGDSDVDGIGTACDNCPAVANAGQGDADEDSIGDVCDNAPTVANPGQEDSDGDGVADVIDNCHRIANPDQFDRDSDGNGDACDNCPAQGNSAQSDRDRDGVGDACDNCPDHANSEQRDCDDDGRGDVCAIASEQSGDCNANGFPDECEIASGAVSDCDGNGVPDSCEPEGYVAYSNAGSPVFVWGSSDEFGDVIQIGPEGTLYTLSRLAIGFRVNAGRWRGPLTVRLYAGLPERGDLRYEQTYDVELHHGDTEHLFTIPEIEVPGEFTYTIQGLTERAAVIWRDPPTVGTSGDFFVIKETDGGTPTWAGLYFGGPPNVANIHAQIWANAHCEPPGADLELRCIVQNNPSGLDERTSLPQGVLEVQRGEAFVVEVWGTDSGVLNTGITGAYATFEYPEACVEVTAHEHAGAFDLFRAGADTGSAILDLGGTQLFPGLGAEPQWVRVATVSVCAHESCEDATFELQPAAIESAAFQRGTVDPSAITYGTCAVTIREACYCVYDIDGNCMIAAGDLGLLAPCWLCNDTMACWTSLDCAAKDFDCNGQVGTGDLSWFAGAWLSSCNEIDPQRDNPECRSCNGTSACTPGATALNAGATAGSISLPLVELGTIVRRRVSKYQEAPDARQSAYSTGDRLVLELWARDRTPGTQGLSAVFVDVGFDPDQFRVEAIGYPESFDLFANAEIDNELGSIRQLGGATLDADHAVGRWELVAWVDLTTLDVAERADLTVGLSPNEAVAAYGRGRVPDDEIGLRTLRRSPGSKTPRSLRGHRSRLRQ